MSDNNQTAPQPEISIPEGKPVYSNLVTVTHSHSEIFLFFGRVVPGVESGHHTEIVLSPQTTKQLADLLQKTVAHFEQGHQHENEH